MEDDTSVRVAVRIRPQISREIINMHRLCTSVTPGEPQVVLGSDKAFTFDYVFDVNSVQMLIYETCVQQLIEGCFEGFNATVLAYGQTGSGKTYSMGTGFDVTVTDDELGIIPRAVEHLFDGIEERRQRAYANNEPIPEFKIHCQFMELYNEEIIDLFETTRDAFSKGKKSSIRIHEDSNGGIYAVGVTTRVVASKQETLKCLKIGALSRTTASTNMNLQSSRSHAIFTLHMKQQRIAKAKDPDMELDTVNEFETLTAKFHFVDLAGSERLKRTGATGERAREGISINCGLLALGNVISSLGDVTKRGSHVPYRDSKLTRLLQDSLGGNSRTLMIACISPSDCDFMETLNTLKYANRARNIRNKVVANQDKNSKTISSLRHEIQLLQLELLEYKQGKRIVVDGEENINDMFHENTMLQTENNNLRVRVKALQETSECLTVKNTQLLTEKATGDWVSSDGDNSDIGTMVQNYIKEVEELRAKYLEAEHTCQMLRRSASRTQTRLSMSPLHSHAVAISGIYDIGVDAHTDEADEILKEAKRDLEKLRENEKTKKQNRDLEEHGRRLRLDDDENGLTTECEVDELSQDLVGDDNEMNRDENNEDSSDMESDEEDEQNREDLADLTCEISIKQKLIEELERSQMRLETMRHQYEEKLIQLQAKIRATQEERDKVLANMGNIENVSEGKAKKVKDEYEKKLNDMMNELKKIQTAKKEHARLLKNQGQYEKQVKLMRGELADMKKAKVRLMNKIKEEASRHKETEQRRNREIAQLKKESRQRQNQIRTLEAEKKLKEAVLKRKQEEVSALRKMNKPMSDRVAGRLPRSRQQMLIQQSKEAAVNKKTSFSPKVAKSKWQHLEKDITKLVLNKKAITSWEADMEHFLKSRETLSQNLEKHIKKRELSFRENKSSGILRDLDDQIESMRANIDYIQENISECQANIMQMEESKDGQDLLDVNNLMSDMGEEEMKYLLNKLLTMTISQSLLATKKDADLKETEAKMQQLEQNNLMQQQLLEHMLQQEGMDLFMYSNGSGVVSSGGSAASSRSVSPVDGVSMGEIMAISSSSTESLKRNRDKARRKTALNPEELLFGGCGESIIPTLNINDDPLECDRITETTSISSARVSSNQSHLLRPVASRTSFRNSRKLSPYSSSFSSSSSAAAASAQPSNNDIGISDPTPPTSPTPQRKGREENVFSRLTGGTVSSEMARPNYGVIRSFLNTKPIARSSPLSCTHVAEGHSRSILCVIATDTLLFSASMDRTVKVWDLHNGSEIATLGGHPNSVGVVRYCDRTRQIFSVSSTFIKIWDLRDSNTKCVKVLHSSGQTTEGSNSVTNQLLTSRENQINDVVVDSHGQRLFSAAGSLVRIWDLRSHCSVGKLNGGHQAAVTCLAVEESDGSNSCVITGSKDHYIKLFEVSPMASGIQLPKFDLEPPHYDGIQTLALSGNVLFSGSRDMCIKKWDLKRAELKQSLNQAHKDWVTGLCFLPSQKGLLSCCRGGYVRLWSVDRCKLLGEVKAHNSAINCLTANGNCVFTASSDTTVRIWRTRSETDISTENTDFR